MLSFFAFLGICCCLPLKESQGGVLDLAVKRSTNFAGLSRRSSSSLDLENAKTYYTVSIDIGDPAVSMDFLVDTGSSDLWVNANTSQATYFDYSKSKTFTKNDTDSVFEIGFGDHSKASGFWGTDTISVFGYSFNASFGVAVNNTVTSQILGIGLQQGESLVKGVTTDGVLFPTYPNFPVLLKTNGIIDRITYSLWLDGAREGNGTLLFGGIDHSKYKDRLSIVPIVNDHSVSVSKQPTTLSVMLHQINITGTKNAFSADINYPVLLDSGSTLCQLPSKVVDSLGTALGGNYSDTLEVYTVNCSTSGVMNFNLSGVTIPVNMSDMIFPLHIVGGKDSPDTCALGVYKTDQKKYVLGDAFLRNAYTVYDLENLQVGIAPAVRASEYQGTSNIEKIGSTIPSATSASLYSHTQFTSTTATSALATTSSASA